METPLTFIGSAVIERVVNGTFVPDRRAQGKPGIQDRRNIISPLAVTRRCIRYEPNVFLHRKAIILSMAEALNSADKKIILVGGPQGIGKTSLIRGVIEMMGSQREQLLWFDVNRHTDFEEIIQFLIQYITYICQAYGTPVQQPASGATGMPGGEPIRRLEALIRSVSDMPLLIVIDNAEYIVDSELRFNSYPFKEMLNFLLGFPNIKMVIGGERLPFAELSPNQPGVVNLKLAGLTAEDAVASLLNRRRRDDPQAEVGPEEEAAIDSLYEKSHGYPWLLKTMLYLYHQSPLDFTALNGLLEGEDHSKASMVGALIRYIYERLSDPQRRLFQILCLLRHPVDVKALQALMGVCYPGLGVMNTDVETLENILEHSLIRPFLKISYPPQEVLEHLRYRQEHPQEQLEQPGSRKFKPWYELYHHVKRLVQSGIPADERERVHGLLQDFYLKERNREGAQRVLRIKNKALLSEAKYHGNAARVRKPVKAEAHAGPDSPQDWLDAQQVSSMSYLYQHVKPLSRKSTFSLEDYRGIRLPEDDFESDPEVLDLSKPLGPVEIPDFDPEEPEEKITFQDYLAGIELTEEEKRLLHETGERPPARPPQDPILASPAPAPAEPPAADAASDLGKLTASLVEDGADEQERFIHQRLARAVASHDRADLALQLLELAKYRAALGRFGSANRCLEKVLSLKLEANKEIMAEIYRLSGTVHKETYHHNAALAALSKAAVYIKRLMYEDETVDAVWMGRLGQVYQSLGEIHAYRRQYREAADSFNQALRWFFSADDEMRQAEVYFQLAGVYEDLKDLENAVQYYQKALAKDEESGNLVSCASALANLGNIAYEQGNLEEAVAYFERSLVYDRQSFNGEGQLNTLEVLAGLYMQLERWDRAEVSAKQGLSLAIQEDLNLWKAMFYVKLGQVAESRQDWPQAITHYEWARSMGEQELSGESLDWIRARLQEVRQWQAAGG